MLFWCGVEILLNESLTLTVEGKVVEEIEDTPDETEVVADDKWPEEEDWVELFLGGCVSVTTSRLYEVLVLMQKVIKSWDIHFILSGGSSSFFSFIKLMKASVFSAK